MVRLEKSGVDVAFEPYQVCAIMTAGFWPASVAVVFRQPRVEPEARKNKTSARRPKLRQPMKFQLNSAPSDAGPIRERNFPSHGSLKRERGVGNLRDASRKGHLTGEGPGLGERADNSKISQSPNPSLALQTSLVFALIGALDVGDSK